MAQILQLGFDLLVATALYFPGRDCIEFSRWCARQDNPALRQLRDKAFQYQMYGHFLVAMAGAHAFQAFFKLLPPTE